MQKAISVVGLSLTACAVPYLMEPWFGDWRWGAAAVLGLVPATIVYRREIWKFLSASLWRRRYSPKATALPPSTEVVPDWIVPALFEHLRNGGAADDEIAGDFEDNARLSRLACWGRQRSGPLRPIPAEHWDHYKLDFASLSCTVMRNSQFWREHSAAGVFTGLQVNKAQALALWPTPLS